MVQSIDDNQSKKDISAALIELGLDKDNKPMNWYKTIVKTRDDKADKNEVKVVAQRGAIDLLSGIVRRFLSLEDINCEYEKLVEHSEEGFIEYTYQDMADDYGMTKRQATNYIYFLEKEMKVIKRHFITKKTQYGMLPNVLYIELFPEQLRQLTELPDSKRVQNTAKIVQKFEKKEVCVTKSENDQDHEEGYISPKKVIPISYCTREKTSINTSINNLNEQTTTEVDSVVVARLKALDLEPQDVNAILKLPEYTPEKCIEKLDLLEMQTKEIHGVTGWIIDALRKDYKAKRRKPYKHAAAQIESQQYDFDELERQLVENY